MKRSGIFVTATFVGKDRREKVNNVNDEIIGYTLKLFVDQKRCNIF